MPMTSELLGVRRCLVIATALLSCVACCSHPSDEELLRRFAAQRVEIERLVADFRREPGLLPEVKRNGESHFVPEERVADYRARLKALGLLKIAGQWETRLVASETRFPNPTIKGYSYRELPPPKTTNEAMNFCYKEGSPFYRRIEGNWYLFWLYQGGS